MTKEELIKSATLYKTLLPTSQQLPEEAYEDVGHPDPDEVFPHAAWMCDEVIRLANFNSNNDLFEANRMLGFVQAILWINGDESLKKLGE